MDLCIQKVFFNPQPSPPLHSKLGCLLFSTSSSNSGTTLHGEEVVKRPKGPLEHNVCTNFVGDRTFLPADIRQALPRGRGVGGDVLVQANEQTEIGPGNKSLRKWLLVSNPRVGTNHEELIWTCFFFFFATFYLWTSKTHKSRLKKSYSNEDLHMVDLVAEGGFLIEKNYRHHYWVLNNNRSET